MVKKKENYELWKIERRERKRAKNARKKAKVKLKKLALRTWKAGRLITFKTLDSNRKWKVFICQIKKCPDKINMHICGVCRMLNDIVPCLNIHTSTHVTCCRKRAEGVFPLIIGHFDKHEKYHKRIKSY